MAQYQYIAAIVDLDITGRVFNRGLTCADNFSPRGKRLRLLPRLKVHVDFR